MNESSNQVDDAVSDAGDSARAIRVGWIAGHQADGPLARLYQPLAIGLMDELVEVTLFHPRGRGEHMTAGSAERIPFAMPGLFGLRATTVRKMADHVSAAKIELLHALDAEAVPLARRISKAARVRYVCSINGVHDAAHIRRMSNRTAAVLAASAPIEEVLAGRGVMNAAGLHTVRPGVYCARQPTCFDESGRSIAIVAGGDETRAQGFEAILKAFAELVERDMDCVFFVICEGKTRTGVRDVAARLGLLDRLTFVDPRLDSQFTGIMKAADVYISAGPPQHMDAHVLLAMAAGSAVICPPDESADFVLDGHTALVYSSGGHEELTTKLISLLDDADYARSLACGALAHVAEYHSAARAVAETAAIYRCAVED